ncbi:MAG: hypothetical protein IPK58_05310 [Acidobacteria bacterium]|nr:hypothetical protein [Acidobacteriota bacterium]
MNDYSRFVLLTVVISVCVVFVRGQIRDPKGDECQERRIARLVGTLETDNILRRALLDGGRGRLIRAEWMDEMQRLFVRQASIQVSFHGTATNLETEVISATYYYAYYDEDAIISGKSLDKIKRSGLDEHLIALARKYVLENALRGIARLKGEEPKLDRNDQVFCGSFYETFLDDEALPALARLGTIEAVCK